MEAVTHGGPYEWGRAAGRWHMRIPVPLKLGPFLAGGNGPIYDLLLIDVTRRGVFITFGREAELAVGSIFCVVRPLGKHDDPVLLPGQLRKIVAEVQIVEVKEGGRALVRVLKGSVIRGTGAERVQGGSVQ
jgi:hypothetical protein